MYRPVTFPHYTSNKLSFKQIGATVGSKELRLATSPPIAQISSHSGRCPVLSEGWGKWKRVRLFPVQINLC